MKRKSLAVILSIIMIATVVPSFSFADEQVIPTIQYGTRYSGTLSADAREQKYKVTLATSGTLNITAQTYVNEYLNLEIYEANGNFLDSDLLSYTTRDYLLSYNLKAGTYYIKFEDPICTGNFSFTAKFIASMETYSYTNDFIKDVKKQASIPLNTNIYGQLALNDHADVYRIDLSSNGELDLQVETFVNQCLNITLYDSNEKLIKSSSILNSKPDHLFSYNLKAGTYYIEFAHSSCTGNYNFTATITKFAVERIKLKPIKKGFVVTAKKRGTINGYEIRYSTNKKAWNIKTIATTSSLSKKIKNLKSKKKYYVQVRQYRKSNEARIYSNWSKSKTVRTK